MHITRKENRIKQQNKRKKWLIVAALTILGIIALFIGYHYYSFQNALSKMNDTTGETDIPLVQKEIKKEPFSVLLLGIDERENDVGRSDTMIVLTINPKEGTIQMLSIPRDTRVEIVGNNTVEKINHAYARGRTAMAIDTVEQFLNIPIDYYVAVNMEGFLSIIDIIGGIEVENDMDLQHQSYTFNKGPITLSGQEALIFSRIRYEDPRGDWGRQVRQRLLIEALMAETKNPKIFLELTDIFSALGDSIKTNLTMTEIKALPQLYTQLDSSIKQMSFEKENGQRIDGLWYYLADEAELAEIQQALRVHLGEELEQKPLQTTE